MSQQYDNTNRGALFINDRKQTDKHPDWKGSLNVGGVEYWISGWDRQSAKGQLVSLTVERKDAAKAQGSKPAPAKRPASSIADIDDSVPF